MKGIQAFLLVLLLLVCRLSALAQNDLKQADRNFNDFEYSLALKNYKAVLENQEPTLAIVQRIAECYRYTNNSKEAEFWYGQVISFPDYDPINLYYYAESAKRNGNYQKAKQLFQDYGRKVPAKTGIALSLAATCDTAMAWLRKPLPMELKYLSSLNSDGADFSPVFYNGGMLFTSDRKTGSGSNKTYGWTGNGYLQLYFAARVGDTTWAKPAALDAAINTQFHNGPASVVESKNQIFFTRTTSIKKRLEKAAQDPTSWFHNAAGAKFINRLELFTAEKKKEKWVNVKPFAYNNTDQYSVGHPAVTADGSVLYFVSDMPGGLGETDIYYSELQSDGTWGKPVNAGPAINTAGKESFPTVGPDGVLYFSSDGHPGMGGLDVFKAVGSHKSWTGVQNLKYPLNSSRDDFGILFNEDGESGFISSGRGNSKESNFDNIYSFKKVFIPCVLQGRSIERIAVAGSTKKRELPVENVKLELLVDGTDEVLTTYSAADGTFFFVVNGGVDYTLRGSKKGYLNQSVDVVPDCRFNTDSVKIEMIFNRDTPNKPIVMENIYYNLDKFDIRPDAAKELDKLVQMLRDNPTVNIELSSHTDSRESHRYNLLLSELRAKAAVEYIVANGIPPARVKAKGYGETKLLNRCKDGVSCSENEHQENRRTEFKILK